MFVDNRQLFSFLFLFRKFLFLFRYVICKNASEYCFNFLSQHGKRTRQRIMFLRDSISHTPPPTKKAKRNNTIMKNTMPKNPILLRRTISTPLKQPHSSKKPGPSPKPPPRPRSNKQLQRPQSCRRSKKSVNDIPFSSVRIIICHKSSERHTRNKNPVTD